MRVSFIHPNKIDTITGGSIYDRKLIQASREMISYEIIEIMGSFPDIGKQELQQFRQYQSEMAGTILVDGLACGLLYKADDKFFETHEVIYLFHNPLQLGKKFSDTQKEKLKEIETEVLSKVDGIICTSTYSLEYLEALVANTPKLLLTPGRPEFREPSGENLIRKTSSSPRILVVGSVTPRKNVGFLIDTLQLVNQPVEVNIVGPTPDSQYLEELKEKIQQVETHNIRIRGKIKDVYNEYKNSDILVHVPKNESYGMVLDEAMSQGLPIIATRVDGIETTLQEAGLKIEQGDMAMLATYITDLLEDDDLYKRMSELSYRVYQRKPTWKEQGAKLVEFLQELRQ